MKDFKITVLVMTYNEEKNLEACLASIRPFVNQIILIDSSSTDRTLEIAEKYNSEIYQYNSSIQAEVMKWALNNCDIRNEWIIRVDSDERWTMDGFNKLFKILILPDINGVYIRRKVFFMGKWLRFGGMYKSHFAVVFRKGYAVMEDKLMDEHLKISGIVYKSDIDVIEANYDRQEDIALWTEKHNRYSTREAIEFLRNKHKNSIIESNGSITGSGVQRKRWFKNNLYNELPLFIRPFLYFIFRYIIQLAFLDGLRGFIHAFLQAFWYRFLVDTKIYQIKRLAKIENKPIIDYMKSKYKINI